ncbi:cytochrome P450 [Wenjunlia tyrosinilytica]|uniref:Cytochrome P450 n=1 Tax=Wenjunlia tyrosinilytica TaxID=1544741 RepID=A0A917ZZ91_9ACTN|nr:cytochrome P450 [Wenjunlia tyrosinilytica]GGP01070.1 cytochrome P450 [Wenjunlia tyrosinilytica]
MKAPVKIPKAPGGLPLLGHALPLLRNPLAFLRTLPARGEVVQIRLGPMKVVMVCDPELTRQILVDDRTFDKGGPMFDRLREHLGDGLATCPHSRHRRQRRLTQPAFHPSRFPAYARTMTQQITRATAKWRHGQVLDVQDEMMALTMRTALETMFSDALPEQAVQEAIADISTMFEGSYRRAVTPPMISRVPTPGNRSYFQARNRLRQTLGEVIAQRRATNTDHGDLLSVLLTTEDTDGHTGGLTDSGLTDAEVSDQVVTFFAAAAETTASALTWALYFLAQEPDIAERVHAEADTALAGFSASHEHLPQLQLTSRVVTEALRLYPPSWMLTRTVTTDTILGGYSMPAGTTVAFSSYLIHRRADLYKEPERFDPDRWDLRHPQPPRHAYIAFGAGARKCIGDQFGLTEAVLALATITAHWRLELLAGRSDHPIVGLTLRGPKNLRMRLSSARPRAGEGPRPRGVEDETPCNR